MLDRETRPNAGRIARAGDRKSSHIYGKPYRYEDRTDVSSMNASTQRRDNVLWISDATSNAGQSSDALLRVLTRAAYDVDRVTRDVAVATVAAREYHIILLSLGDAYEDSLAVLRAIRDREDTSATPVVVITSRSIPSEILARAFVDGAHDHIDDGLSERSIEARLGTARQWRGMVLRLRERAARSSKSSGPVPSNECPRSEGFDARTVLRALLPAVPQSYGALRISGEVLASSDVRGDLFDVVVDDERRVSVFALSTGGLGAASIELVTGAQDVVRASLEHGNGLDAIGSRVNEYVASQEGSLVVSMALLRFSADASSVEVFNVGYPPIVSTRGGARVVSFPARSKPFGLLENERHPFELVSVPPGATFAIASDGLIASSDAASAIGIASAIGLAGGGLALASRPGSELRALMEQITGKTEDTIGDDATLIVIAVDPTFTPRFPSPVPTKKRLPGGE
jgi:serine phosphatase RsbU (regulator of sigma subunit)/CheY-like chemotaxis protein